jgi:hypothetical protein
MTKTKLIGKMAKYLGLAHMAIIFVMMAGCASINSRDPVLRIKAIEQTTDQATLVRIALSDSDPKVRLAATNRLNNENQSDLKMIAQQDSDPSIRKAAVTRLSDQSAIASVALNDADAQVRLAAVARLSDQSTITSIALNDVDTQIREAALAKVKEQSALTKIAQQNSDPLIREAAVKKLSDQIAIITVAKSDSSSAVRLVATRMVMDGSVLAEIAGSDTDTAIRNAAIGMINDPNILIDLLKTEKDTGIREILTTKLSFLKMLNQLSANTTMPKVLSARIYTEGDLADCAYRLPGFGYWEKFKPQLSNSCFVAFRLTATVSFDTLNISNLLIADDLGRSYKPIAFSPDTTTGEFPKEWFGVNNNSRIVYSPPSGDRSGVILIMNPPDRSKVNVQLIYEVPLTVKSIKFHF